MVPRVDPRPGVAYRRPDGDPGEVILESATDPDLPVEDLPREGWLDAVHTEDRDRLRKELANGDVDVAYRVVHDGSTSDDGPIWVHERGRRDTEGDVVGYLFPAYERIERQRRLERERERLEEFASVVSHDLRNPLSVAVGNLEVAREIDGDAAVERIDRAQGALARMDALISDVLSLAREGRSVESTAETDLRLVVDRAWATVGRAVDATLVVDGALPRIDCDRSRLRQALENLFRNAVEHGSTSSRTASGDAVEHGSSDGSGTAIGAGPGETAVGWIARGASEAEADDGAASADVRVFVGLLDDRDGFYVADDGPGIPEAERETVFEPGYTTAEEGTGFGLAIVERIATAHGWSVSVTEGEAGGARFEFTGVETFADPERRPAD